VRRFLFDTVLLCRCAKLNVQHSAYSVTLYHRTALRQSVTARFPGRCAAELHATMPTAPHRGRYETLRAHGSRPLGQTSRGNVERAAMFWHWSMHRIRRTIGIFIVLVGFSFAFVMMAEAPRCG
jgi:hypothetical protein